METMTIELSPNEARVIGCLLEKEITTPEQQLRTYTGFFEARIMRFTGAPELVKRAADNFKVRHEKVIDPRVNPAHYAVDHSAGMFLLAPGGQFLAKFPYGKPVDEIVARLREEIARLASADGAPMQGVPK